LKVENFCIADEKSLLVSLFYWYATISLKIQSDAIVKE